jgi:hypothetical protein
MIPQEPFARLQAKVALEALRGAILSPAQFVYNAK